MLCSTAPGRILFSYLKVVYTSADNLNNMDFLSDKNIEDVHFWYFKLSVLTAKKSLVYYISCFCFHPSTVDLWWVKEAPDGICGMLLDYFTQMVAG